MIISSWFSTVKRPMLRQSSSQSTWEHPMDSVYRELLSGDDQRFSSQDPWGIFLQK
jgi:hypothetical protein